MRTRSEYGFELPQAQIAQVPAERRDRSRLLVVGPEAPIDRLFHDIAGLLPENAVVVVNDSRVFPARLRARKSSGGAVELVLVEPVEGDATRWMAIARASKPIRKGAELSILSGEKAVARAEVRRERDPRGHIVIDLSSSGWELAAAHGEVPLPPYIERPSEARDRERYQTVYAAKPGAVAAPTAGLHFTEELLEEVRQRGADVVGLTLHVGPGTFAPIRGENLEEHRLHEERFHIPEQTAELVNSDRPVVAVGTTSVRALEAAAAQDGAVRSGWARTDLFIREGYRFRVVDQLITNFHLPESSLLVLVCAFAGYERVMGAYRHAVADGYRFFSYGDAMLLTRENR